MARDPGSSSRLGVTLPRLPGFGDRAAATRRAAACCATARGDWRHGTAAARRNVLRSGVSPAGFETAPMRGRCPWPASPRSRRPCDEGASAAAATAAVPKRYGHSAARANTRARQPARPLSAFAARCRAATRAAPARRPDRCRRRLGFAEPTP